MPLVLMLASANQSSGARSEAESRGARHDIRHFFQGDRVKEKWRRKRRFHLPSMALKGRVARRFLHSPDCPVIFCRGSPLAARGPAAMRRARAELRRAKPGFPGDARRSSQGRLLPK
jgi:hypothetical protein